MAYNNKSKPVTKTSKVEITNEPENVAISAETDSEVEVLKKQVMSQQNQLEELKSLILQNTNRPEVSTKSDSMDRWCTIIHLEDRAEGLYTIIRSSLIEYRFSFFGESRKVRRAELDDIISKNRKWFERLAFTLGADDSDLIEEYNLPQAEKVVLQPRQLSNMAALPLEDLKKIYNKVCDTHKQLIIRKWVAGYYENKDGNFRNVIKINLLNDLSNGSLTHIIEDCNEQKRVRRS